MNIAQHRKAAGLTQMDMAKLLGLSQKRTLSTWENSPDDMKLGTLKAYATACGVNIFDLMGVDGEAQDKLARVREVVI